MLNYMLLFTKFQFFDPLEPIEITILYNNNNRPSGEANVEFGTKDDALRAMSKVNLFVLLKNLSSIVLNEILMKMFLYFLLHRTKHTCSIDI